MGRLREDRHGERRGINDVKTVLSVEGLVCDMCDAHMDDAIRKAFPVKKVTTSHSKGETVIISENEFSRGDL